MLFEELEGINDQLMYIGNSPEQYKDAIMGISHDNNHLIYSWTKLVELMMNEGMSNDDAVEWINCNTIRSLSYQGEFSPIIMFDIDK